MGMYFFKLLILDYLCILLCCRPIVWLWGLWGRGKGVGVVFSSSHPSSSWTVTVIFWQAVFNKYILSTLCHNVCAPN